MKNQKDKLVDILTTAIKFEDNGLITYLEFARKTKHETGKNMFITLAMDENQHRSILEEQLNELLEKGKWKNVVVSKSEIEQITPAIREKQKRTKGESGLNDVDALNTALDLEKKSVNYYREKAELVSELEAKSLLLRLAEWEDSHFDLIQAELDSINQTGLWFGIPEFRMDGKF